VGKHELLEDDEGTDREHGGERLVGLAQLVAEQAAAVAALHVPTHRRGHARQALGHLAELESHRIARELPRLGRLGQGDARAYEQRLDAGDRGVHRLPDLLIGQRVDLPQQKRRALRLGQSLDIGEQQSEVLTTMHLVGRREAALRVVDVHRVHADRLLSPQVVEAAVPRDAVEPRPNVERPVVGLHCVERGREHLLEHVLGILLGREHVPAEREQACLVAAHQGLEGAVMASTNERDETLVGGEAQEGRSPMEAGQAGWLES
jgi:hypothetical protein